MSASPTSHDDGAILPAVFSGPAAGAAVRPTMPLTVSVRRDDAGVARAPAHPGTCACCGLPAGIHGGDGSCAACHLVRHLERPRIDAEVCLTWVPEMSQAALICLVREMHRRLRAGGEGFDGEPGPVAVGADRRALHYARLALSGRIAVASAWPGALRPSELAQILARMSRPMYDRRRTLLGGLRVLPVGRFFVGADDVYPAIVDSWRQTDEPSSMPEIARSAAR